VNRAEAAPAGFGPPLAVRLIVLLMIGWLITLAMSVALVILLPPPNPGIYRLSEIEAALRGGSLKTREGRPLVRMRRDEPPHRGELRLTSGIYRLALAGALNLPPTRVRFERYPISDPVQRVLLRALSATPPAGVGPPGALAAPYYVMPARPPAPRPRPSGDARAGPPIRPPDAAGVQAFPLDSFPPVVGNFSAAAQDASGGWIVVRPAPELFPNPWQQRIFLWFLLCFGVLAPIGYLFARRLTAPIGRFAQAAEQLGRDPRETPLELSGPAEIGRAAAAFNQMQDRLRRYVEHRTAMVGAMAHDLRTPLARIRFKIESLSAEAREPIARDIAQMEQMISAALVFVREASQHRTRELLDLSSVLQCVVDSAALVGADVKIVSAEPLVVHADGLALERLFANLIDNAVKYGRRARVKVYREAQSAVVDVADSGRGVPAAELERVFEPFYRVEPSRSPETGGMGLGLSVARSVARAHGGDIELINGRGLTARVRLPLALEPPSDAFRTAAASEPA
jgi:signal transduction histidine kinase